MGDRDSLPANLKSMQPYLDVATDYESILSGGPEDPNVWKPKHASKTKEEKENTDKASTEVIKSTGFTQVPRSFCNLLFINRQC
jgi:hypothetical protein